LAVTFDGKGGRQFATPAIVAVVLLVLFPLLLLVNPPLAAVSLVAAIVLLYRGKTTPARHRSVRSYDDTAI
jgi:hypothetical protein